VQSLDLARAGVAFTPEGVTVNAYLQTSARHVFACGDVAGPYAFTHTADAQARVVVRNLLLPRLLWAKMDHRVVPWVTYTDPELAQVGLTEEGARQQGLPVDAHRVGFEELDRAILEREERGFLKVLTAPGKDRILGATVVGPHAGEVMHELVLAMKAGIGLGALSGTIHAYPTFSAAVQRAADAYRRKGLTPFAKRVTSWLYRVSR
jgi:pyruvate/2-oxoglutarate dehydrogenase complex dihydrolipoamide dehydrogenase (E3) component